MSKKHNITHQFKEGLKAQCKFGESKAEAKAEARKYAKENNCEYKQPMGIYAKETLKSYEKYCSYFASYCLTNHSKDVRSWEDCKKYLGEYINSLSKTHSAWTVRAYATGIASSYGERFKDIAPDVTLPSRERANIVRGRDLASKGLEYDERYEKTLELYKATGCRRIELLRLRPCDFREQLDDKGNKTGNLEVYKRGKGGLERWCLVNPNYTDMVREYISTQPTFKINGENRFVRKADVPKTEVHSYRADYARDLYDYYEEQGFATGKLYRCRKDMAGVIYDKGLLQKVSFDLQHGRTNVVLNYLWK